MAHILKSRTKLACTVTTLVTVFILSTNISLAQVTAQGIRGVVFDPSGAVIPGVQIQATNLQTNAQFSTLTSDAGNYVLEFMPIGNYGVEAELPGFTRILRQPVYVVTATTTTLNFTLQIGEVAEQVTVEGSVTPLLQPDGSDLTTTMERRLVIDLPLEIGAASQIAGSGRRSIENFIYNTPGVTGTGWNKHFLGSPQHTTQAIVDGIPFVVQESPGLTEVLPPPYEAVEEFTVTTTNYPANIGRGFGIIHYSTRSGTNAFHGNVFWIHRNDATDARGFFAADKPIIRQNEYGFTLGGPIVKDKTFFFGAWDGFKRRGGSSERGLVTIPSLAFRQGDFSELKRTDTGELIPIFDPATTRSDGQGGFVRDAFPNNIIPANRIDPVAKFYMDQLPQPDFPGIVENWVNKTAKPADDDVYSVKINHTINDSHRLSGTFWRAYYNETRVQAFGLEPIGRTYQTVFQNVTARVNWDWVISPTLLNHFGVGYLWYDKVRSPFEGSTLTNADSGIKGIPPATVPTLASMQAGIQGSVARGVAGTGYLRMGNADVIPDNTLDETFVFTDTVSWIRGRHQFKFGGDYWNSNFSRENTIGEGGILRFDQLSTSQPNSPNNFQWGDPLASMLLGQVASGQLLNSNVPIHTWDTDYLAFFIEDKVQVTPKLTLTLGVRYDYPTPIAIRQDTFSAIDLNLANPAAGGIPGAYRFGREADGLLQSKNEWAPRVALGYAINDKTVLRVGYGLIYAQSNAQTNAPEIFGNKHQSGFSAFSTPVTLDNGVTPAFELDDGFPAFEGTLPDTDPGIEVGGVGDWINPGAARSAYTTNWSLTLQREVPLGFFVDLTYVGVKGSRLPSNSESLSQVPAGFLSLGSTLQADINSQAAQDAGISPPFDGFQGSVAQALRPYPQYTSFVPHYNPNGNHTYNALLMKVQRRFAQGLGVLVSYTLSKNISDTNGNAWSGLEPASIDTGRRYLEKSISPLDRTHNLVTNWIYELPFGDGSGGAANKLAHGWQIGLTTSYVSGPPLAIGGGPPLPLFGGGNRPLRVEGVDKRSGVSNSDFDPASDLYLNIGAFEGSAPFTFGDVGRVEGDLHGFSSFGENLSVVKRTFVPSITEEFNVEFRAEFFNLFNHTVFSSPAANINSPASYGRVSGQVNVPRHIQFTLKINF